MFQLHILCSTELMHHVMFLALTYRILLKTTDILLQLEFLKDRCFTELNSVHISVYQFNLDFVKYLVTINFCQLALHTVNTLH